MKRSSASLLVFGMYLIGMGLGLALMPNFVLGLLGFPPATDVWVRVVGVLAWVLAFYYISAARADLRPFAQMTVYGRIGVFVAFAVLALTGFAGPVLILLGAVDLFAAVWTGRALKSEA